MYHYRLFCAPEGSRTPNLLIRSQMLYPVKLQVQYALFKATANIKLLVRI